MEQRIRIAVGVEKMKSGRKDFLVFSMGENEIPRLVIGGESRGDMDDEVY